MLFDMQGVSYMHESVCAFRFVVLYCIDYCLILFLFHLVVNKVAHCVEGPLQSITMSRILWWVNCYIS